MAGGYAIPGLLPPDANMDEEERKRLKAEADANFEAGQQRMATGLKVLAPVTALAKPIGEMIEGEPAQAAEPPPGPNAAPAPRAPGAPPTPAAIPNTGATITQRGPGGTSVSLPLTGGSELDQRTSRGSRTETRREVTAAERAAQAQGEQVTREQVQNAEEKKNLLMEVAREEQANKDALAHVAATKEKDATDRMAAYEAEIARRQGIADQTETEYKAQLQDFQQTDPKKRFWSKQDTPAKLQAGLSMLLGVFGGLKDGSNVGAERIIKEIDADTQRTRDALEAKERMLDRARGDVRTAKDDIHRQKELIDLRSAVAKERVLAEADALGAKYGISKAEIEGNEGILKIRESAAADRLKLEQSRAATVQKEQSWSNVTTNAGGGPAGADKPLAKWSQGEKEAEGFASRMMKAHEDMGRFQYNARDVQMIKDAAWRESTLPKWMQATNDYVRGTFFQKLSPEGKKRFLAEQEFARSNLRKESGAQISMAETLSEIEGIGERPGDNADTRAMKNQQRLLKVRGTGIASGRPSYWDGVIREQATRQAPSANPQIEEAKAWLLANPTHPKAAAVAERLRGLGVQ